MANRSCNWSTNAAVASSNTIGVGSASELTVAGSPETVRKFLAAQVEDSKANYIVGQFCFGDLTLEDMLRSVELFATKVKPALQAALV